MGGARAPRPSTLPAVLDHRGVNGRTVMDESPLLARLQFLVGALRSLLRLTATPTRNAALSKRCQEIRECLEKIEAEVESEQEDRMMIWRRLYASLRAAEQRIE